MIITSITPERISHYLAGLARKANQIPGCKVKQSHLLEAASAIEGESSWRSFENRISKRLLSYSFVNKEATLLWLDGKMVVSGVVIQVSVRGFVGVNITVNSYPCRHGGWWLKPCEPKFVSNGLDGTLGLSEAMDNFKTALSDVTEICLWLNDRNHDFNIDSFREGWCLRVATSHKLESGVLKKLSMFGFVEPESHHSDSGLKEYLSERPPERYEIKGVDTSNSSVPVVLHSSVYEGSYDLFNKIRYFCEKHPGFHVYFDRV